MTDPVRFAPTTADARVTTPMLLMFNPREESASRQGVVLPRSSTTRRNHVPFRIFAAERRTGLRRGRRQALAYVGKRLPCRCCAARRPLHRHRRRTARYRGSPSEYFPPTTPPSAPWIPMGLDSSALNPLIPTLQGVPMSICLCPRRARSDGAGTGALRRRTAGLLRGLEARRADRRGTSGSATAPAKVCSVPPPSGICGPTC